jgi:hypothetical protein
MERKVGSMKILFVSISLFLMSCASVKTNIEINAPAKIVENILFDSDQYPDWNPFIKEIQGDLKSGSKVKVIVKPVGKPQMEFSPVVLAANHHNLSWRGRFLMPGVFTGEHEFIIEKLDSNKTLFYQREKFSGILIPFFGIGPTQGGFELMNLKLKERAESKSKEIGN